MKQQWNNYALKSNKKKKLLVKIKGLIVISDLFLFLFDFVKKILYNIYMNRYKITQKCINENSESHPLYWLLYDFIGMMDGWIKYNHKKFLTCVEILEINGWIKR